MRLPDDPENWSIYHAEKAIKEAEKIFVSYENKYDADKKEETDNLYLTFLHAREQAIVVANTVGVKDLIHKAEMLG